MGSFRFCCGELETPPHTLALIPAARAGTSYASTRGPSGIDTPQPHVSIYPVQIILSSSLLFATIGYQLPSRINLMENRKNNNKPTSSHSLKIANKVEREGQHAHSLKMTNKRLRIRASFLNHGGGIQQPDPNPSTPISRRHLANPQNQKRRPSKIHVINQSALD